jgi:hypothetical protein
LDWAEKQSHEWLDLIGGGPPRNEEPKCVACMTFIKHWYFLKGYKRETQKVLLNYKL